MRFRITAILFSVLVPLLVSAKAGTNGSLAATLARIDKAAENFKSLSADVRRVHHLAVINDDEVDTGSMLLKRSKPRDIRMFIELTHPDEKSLAFQGKKLEIYYPKIQTVQEFDIGKNRELLDQFFLMGFGTTRKELESAYDISYLGSETISNQKTDHLELVPKSNEVAQHLQKFQLWISDAGYPVQQKFFLPGDETMLVTYSNVKINPDLSDSALKLRLPKGVKREYPQR